MAMGKQQGSGGMNRDDIIRLAREADCLDPQHYGSAWADKLERFAALAAAAEQLGYDVVLRADADGLCVQYVRKIPDAPYEWRK